MKGNELMIGDWVEVIQNGNPAYAQIQMIDGYGDNAIYNECICDGIYYNINEIKPIPLTAEILEKNGFKVTQYFVGLTVKPEYKMVYRNELKNIEKNIITIRQSSDMLFDMQVGIGSHIYDITYIHELQHALKLCGIDKQIEL
jgi:hypothetical protein